MTTISHKNLTGAQLHENKGAASASDNTVATITSGATVWTKLTASNLTGTGNPFGGQLLQIQDQRASGTNGDTPTATTWTKKTLQTTLTNEITSATITSSVISLPSGTYFADGWILNYASNHGRVRLQNTTDASTLVLGASIYAVSSTSHVLLQPLRGRFTLSGTKNVELQYYYESATGHGLGEPYAAPGVVEVYSDLCIWKIA